MKKRLFCALLCALLCLTQVMAATPLDRFAFQEQYAADYAREHPEEYAAFDAVAAYEDDLYRATQLPREVWMANRDLDEAGFKAVMWTMHLSARADEAYVDYATGTAFPAVAEYPGFADVAPGSWYESAVTCCYVLGLMQGTDLGFEPEKALTVGECAAVAARIREALTGQPSPSPSPDEPWYAPYTGYMTEAQPTLTPMLAHPTEPISRMQYLLLLNAAIPENMWLLLTPINVVETLPDTEDDTVRSFYRAGILTGVDQYGSFAGDKALTRAECAAMVARLVRSELRLSFSLTPWPPADAGSPMLDTEN